VSRDAMRRARLLEERDASALRARLFARARRGPTGHMPPERA